MLSSINSAILADDPYEILISQMIQLESQPKFVLETRRTEADRFKAVLTDFDSKLSALHTLTKSFTDLFSNPFEGRTVSGVDETDGFSVSVTDQAAYGTHSLQIQRLASTDSRVSKQFTSAGSDLVNFFSTNGSQTFSIDVASPTTGDPSNRETISVTIDPVGTDDESILKEISTAIDAAMDAAVTAGTIKSTERASSSTVNETSTTARLSLRSGQTGFTNRLTFTDSGNGLLSLLEVNSASVVSGTNGGQITAIGTSETDSALNSKFILDGLTLYRDSNAVSDALEGITLSLSETATTATDFTVEPDASGIEDEVKDFIEKYNDVLSYISGKANVDASTGTRGDFAGDSTISGLRFGMRTDMALQVTGQPSGAPSYLSDLGIEINTDGTLELKDSDALIAAVRSDAGSVQSLFAGADGIATRLTNRLDSFLGINGIIDVRQDALDDRITRLDDQIGRWDSRMAIRENQLRQQFARLQQVIAAFQGQQQLLNSFFYR